MAQPNLKAVAAADARRYGIPVNVFERQIQQESGFNPNARSSAGAEGIAQFMPATARGFGLSDPFDPVASLDAAARYDSNLIHKYGSLAEALSAYNSGRPDAYKDPNFAHGQTYNYVRSILGGAGKTAGGSPSPASVSVGAPAPSPGAPTGSSPLLGQLLAQTNEMVGLDTAPNLASLFIAPAAAKRSAPAAPAAPAAAPRSLQSASEPAGFVPLDGVTVDRRIAPQVSQIVRQFGVKPTSGLRSAEHNAQVGGAQNSDHLRGDAVDFAGSPQALRALYQWAQGRFPYVEPWAQTGGSHDHISFRR